MRVMKKKLLAILFVLLLLVTTFSGCLEDDSKNKNEKPVVEINYPIDKMKVSSLVMISGTSYDLDGNEQIKKIEVKMGDGDWKKAQGTIKWSFDWDTYKLLDGVYSISVRAWDGIDFSKIEKIQIEVDNPRSVEIDSHKYAVFIATANFPEENESKLGNGGLYLAEEMAAYFVESLNYATSNIVILFDDGWIRSDNGYGEKIETLQQRQHDYAFTYGGATKNNVLKTFDRIINESNRYRDSEVFIWMFSHGYGDSNDSLAGGKLFERSQIFLWDDILSDRDFGQILLPLKSSKVSIIIDACFCGGFADKTILNFPTSILFRSKIPQNGRIVISSTSKFRKGFTSTLRGPIFSLLWFEGLKTGNADGYKSGLFSRGIQRQLGLFKNDMVSVEEAFFYAKYILENDEDFKDFEEMQPQINDRYPRRGFILSLREMHLGEG